MVLGAPWRGCLTVGVQEVLQRLVLTGGLHLSSGKESSRSRKLKAEGDTRGPKLVRLDPIVVDPSIVLSGSVLRQHKIYVATLGADQGFLYVWGLSGG